MFTVEDEQDMVTAVFVSGCLCARGQMNSSPKKDTSTRPRLVSSLSGAAQLRVCMRDPWNFESHGHGQGLFVGQGEQGLELLGL